MNTQHTKYCENKINSIKLLILLDLRKIDQDNTMFLKVSDFIDKDRETLISICILAELIKEKKMTLKQSEIENFENKVLEKYKDALKKLYFKPFLLLFLFLLIPEIFNFLVDISKKNNEEIDSDNPNIEDTLKLIIKTISSQNNAPSLDFDSFP